MHHIKLMATGLFVVCLLLGAWLSLQKPLWSDEIYTQQVTIDRLSYREILLSHFPEGNITPLFYLIQKAISDAAGFHLPKPSNGRWNYNDQWTQFILRISSNVAMSLALVIIFYFFVQIILLLWDSIVFWLPYQIRWFGSTGRKLDRMHYGFY